MTLQAITLLPATADRSALTYCLLHERRPCQEENAERDSFSLLCRLGTSACLLPDITSERERADELLCLFATHTVTPYTALEVVEELLA